MLSIMKHCTLGNPLRRRPTVSNFSHQFRPYSNQKSPLIYEESIIDAHQSLWTFQRRNDSFVNDLSSKQCSWTFDEYHKLSNKCSALPDDSPLFMHPPAFSSPKEKIVRFALGLIPQLMQGQLRGKFGGTSHLLLGPKGIGKTHSLRSLTVCLSLMDPNLCVIYIDYMRPNETPGYFLRQAFLSRFPEESIGHDLYEILKAYYSHGLKALIIADELDVVYARQDNDHGRQILDDLAVLGSNAYGSNVVIACGSSAVLPQLISRNGAKDPMIREEYPLVKQCAHLNGTKYPSFRVGSGHPSSNEQYFQMWNALLRPRMPRVDSPMELNFLFFMAGSNMRCMDNVLHILLKSDIEDVPLELANIYNWDARCEWSRRHYEDLIQAIQTKLIEKNKQLIDRMVDQSSGEIHFGRASSIDWTKWQGVSRHELEIILNDQSKTLGDVQLLVDKYWFTAGPNVHSVHTISPMHLCYAFLHSDYLRKENGTDTFKKSMKKFIISLSQDAVKQSVLTGIKLSLEKLL